MPLLQLTTDHGQRTALFPVALAFVITICLAVLPAWALSPDELLLIGNSNSLEGALLVEHYRELRGVPKENVVALKVPLSESISTEDYQQLVVPPIRQFLRQHHLEQKIKCLVTFYGMPIRILPRRQTVEVAREINSLQDALSVIRPQLTPAVDKAEDLAQSLNPTFHVVGGATIEDFDRRANAAGAVISVAIDSELNPQKKNAAISGLINAYAPLLGLGPLIDRLGSHITFRDAAAAKRVQDAVTKYKSAVQTISNLKDQLYDPAIRRQVRDLVRDNFGLLEYARILQGQLDYLQIPQSGSALDNELPLVMWDYYPRTRWMVNPYRYGLPPLNLPQTFMVMRIDAPTPKAAERLIDDSIATEKSGLHGVFVIDAQSLGGHNSAYDECDLHLARLYSIVQDKSKITPVYDYHKEVITRPLGHYIKNVALYCGWYSVNQYIPAFEFARGAVGFHIASFTMNTLHNPPGNWCLGLMKDGVDATLGPCDEPYLTAFPLADEFFPLLMTGKLTLAEVYWKTTPMTSWMMSMIGDPLYTPFKADPAIAVSDLPMGLQRAVTQANGPSGR